MWLRSEEGPIVNLQEFAILELVKVDLANWAIIASGIHPDSRKFTLVTHGDHDGLTAEMLKLRQLANIELGFPAYTLQ